MQQFELHNDYLSATFLDYGAILHELWVTNTKGESINIIQGLASPDTYLIDSWCHGAVVGRYAGRLTESFILNNKKYLLDHTDGVLLHSGETGWHRQYWQKKSYAETELTLQHTCLNGNGGFPGTVQAQITYRLQEQALVLEYRATTDAPTHINLTNHAYFSLNPKGKLDEQYLQIEATHYLELAQNLVPTGVLLKTDQTAMDFSQPRPLGTQRLDDYFVLNSKTKTAAKLYSPQTGISMHIQTDQPGLVVFTPTQREAICFETQKFSNTPNLPHFPSTYVAPEQPYLHHTRFEFSGIAAR